MNKNFCRSPNNQYSGTASDVVGEATGISEGNALNWKYKLNLKVGDSTILVDFDDWMFLQDRNILMNRAEVKKWGLNIGVVSITCLLYTSPSPRDRLLSRMPSSA